MVTGPFYSNYQSETLYWHKESYRSSRPWTRPLPYKYIYGAVSPGPVSALELPNFGELGSALMNRQAIYNKAYAKLVDQLGEHKASLGITLSQWREADSMIRRRGLQLLAFTSALVRGSPSGVARSLGLSLSQVKKVMGARYGAQKKLSDLWLEFHFGWEPLVKDVYGALQVFSKDITLGRIRSTAVDYVEYKRVPPGQFAMGFSVTVEHRVRIGCDVHLYSPDLLLLQQLGLLNPLSVAFDAIPWSFVLDWFTGVQACLESITDFAGFTVKNVWTTRSTRSWGSFYWPAYPQFAQGGIGLTLLRGTSTDVPPPQMTWTGISFKPTRGLTAITLLTQKLAGLHVPHRPKNPY